MDYIGLIVGLLFGIILLTNVAYLLVIKPHLYSEARQREQVAADIAYVMANYVLHRAFGYSHVTIQDNRRKVEYVRFLTPYGRRLTLTQDETGNNHPDSYLTVWDWSNGWQTLPIGSIYLELDLNHIPYDHTVDWLIDHKDDIEIHAGLVLMDYGVQRVKLKHYWLADRKQRRIIFRVVFREREKSPAIPQHVDFGEMLTALEKYEFNRQGYNRLERLEREKLAARVLNYGINHYGGTFPLKKLQATFAKEISHRQIEALGQRFEREGILEPIGGPYPRRVNPEAAADYLKQQSRPTFSYGGGDPRGVSPEINQN